MGWDKTDWKTAEDLQHVLDVLAHDPNVSGDNFWALQAHLDNFGFQPIPADSGNAAFAGPGEGGEWWALYYPGVKSLVMSAEDMAARAQQLRTQYATSAPPTRTTPGLIRLRLHSGRCTASSHGTRMAFVASRISRSLRCAVTRSKLHESV